MIQRLSHTTIWVFNQEESLAFYRDKLGFKVHTDHTMDNGFRWLTLTAPADPDFEFVLMEPSPSPMLDAETAEAIRVLVKKGAMGTGVLNTDDCRATYEELKAKGVEFLSPPNEQFYGIEVMLKDNSGNLFSLCQPKPGF